MESVTPTTPTVPDQPYTPEKSYKTLIILVVILFIITGGALGYFGKDYLEPQLVDQQVSDLQVSKPQSKKAKAVEITLPSIIFQPDTFTADEKAALKKNLIDPIVDYETENQTADRTMTAFVVEKMPTPTAGYKFKVSQYYTNNGWGGFLYGNAETGAIPLWVPDCLGDCKFTETFKQKHPEVIAEYNKNK